MEEKEKIIEKIRYLVEKSEYFTRLKDEESFLFEELKKIKKSDLDEVMKYYKGEEKVKKIRYLAAKSLLENELTQEKLETIKIEVNSEYKKNILRAWKNFGLLYVLFFNPIKEKVKNHLKEISSFILPNLELKFKIKNIDFDGSQNQGRGSCWIVFYNPKYKSQSEGYQYAVDLNIKDLHYGVYHHKTKENFFEETFNKEEINEELLEKIIKSLKEYSSMILEEGKKESINKVPLNQILYGPPGTGKTYNTINKALEIIDNEFYLENQNKREILKEKFEEYKRNGQIEFITFHQSYGYEEFVEGIKAIPAGKEGNKTEEMIYDVVDGVFKRLCKAAQEEEYQVENINLHSNSKVWKISLGGTGKHQLKDKCFKNDEVRIGWDHVKSIYDENFKQLGKNDKSTIKYFIEDMNIGDIVVSIYSEDKIDGIGIIEGEYEKIKDDEYDKRRKVKWLIKNKELEFKELNGNIKFTQQTVYELWRVNLKDIIKLIEENQERKIEKKESNLDKNYVLIIDEINRGNISKVFGELITLLEDCKRLGNKEALEIPLPYSSDKFGVPKNIYILGTMNTADRSIALMDTALRRRFDFEEMMPKYDLETISTDINGINLQEVLRVINQRIEYLYDRDHMIGHAYFIGIKTKKQLDSVMRNKIIPLLQEYFYDDWEKIQIVLGDHEKQKYETSLDNADRFIVAEKLKEIDILGFDHDDIEDESISYTINSKFTETAYMIYEEE